MRKWFAPLTPDAVIISPSGSLKQKSDVQARWQIHSSEDNVSLWGATCHSLPRVGHTFLSLPWWISFPRPHVDLSGLKGRLWVSCSHHKVPFVPAMMRSIHTCPRGDTWCQRMSTLRKELDQQAPMGTELGNKWTFYFKKQNVNFGSPNSVFSISILPLNLRFFFFRICHSFLWNPFDVIVLALMSDYWWGKEIQKPKDFFPTDRFLNLVLRAPEVQILSELIVSGWFVLSCLNLLDPRVSVLNPVSNSLV